MTQMTPVDGKIGRLHVRISNRIECSGLIKQPLALYLLPVGLTLIKYQ